MACEVCLNSFICIWASSLSLSGLPFSFCKVKHCSLFLLRFMRNTRFYQMNKVIHVSSHAVILYTVKISKVLFSQYEYNKRPWCNVMQCNGKERTIHHKRGLNRGPLDLKSSTPPNELKRYPTSAVLVVVLINPNYNIPAPLGPLLAGVSTCQFQGRLGRGTKCNDPEMLKLKRNALKSKENVINSKFNVWTLNRPFI